MRACSACSRASASRASSCSACVSRSRSRRCRSYTAVRITATASVSRGWRQWARLAVSVGLVVVVMLAGVALAYGAGWPGSLGIDPTRHSYGAAVYMLLGWVGVHVGIGAFMAIWCLARVLLGMLDSWRCLTLRVCLLWWRFTVAATALVLVLVAGFPYAFR